MFDKIFEFIRVIWDELVPFFIVTEMELACVLRLGKYHHISKPGVHFKIPFVDSIYSYHVKTRTSHLASQTLTTFDNKAIVIKAIVRYNIFDVKLYTIEIWDAHEAISDTIQGIISDIIKDYEWEEILKGIEGEIYEKASEVLKNWGIKVEKITLSDLGLIRTIKLLNNQDTISNQI